MTRVAVVATFTADGVLPLLRSALEQAGIEAELHLCPFGQVETELTAPDSGLARFAPDVTLVLLHDGAFLPAAWDPTRLDGVEDAVRARLESLESAIAGRGTVVLHTVPLSRVEQRTVVSYRGRAALGRLWRRLNSALLELPDRHPSVHVLDLEAVLVDEAGPVRDERLYRYASMAWSAVAERAYAREAAAFCRAVAGRSAKVLVLDGDNTLWGGVVGDDGLAGIQLGPLYPGNAHVDLQRRALALRRQGVLLALASKNSAEVVDELLAEHPGMVLRPTDFVALAVNWQPKDGNLRELAAELNVGLDSFVFADDSRFERELVREALPSVRVVPLDGDPAGFSDLVLADDHFAVLETTETDRSRTDLYRARRERNSLAAFSSPEEYLHELQLVVAVREATRYDLPRLVQLSLRTNQFVMVRGAHSETGTREFAESPDRLLLAISVSDRFGDEGVVGGIWVSRGERAWTVDNFVLSCRVFSRGVEHTALQAVMDRAIAAGAERLDAAFVASERNQPAASFYPSVGFEAREPSGYSLPLRPPPAVRPAWATLIEGETADV
ncbi:HAD-IIIC family phosphatase [Lentzea nigeriaca]|uniref:HAD-IIIC family phosphatase n=1 Tax=Lentzea nigeriaca TaxID=1128665 RepID=UPI00195EFED0|nr:HAD-IIIC family phosphatase [Lentzea nigeriaca]MBM7863780.1 FkbH-like protein [Lentzea nigeriaca]